MEQEDENPELDDMLGPDDAMECMDFESETQAWVIRMRATALYVSMWLSSREDSSLSRIQAVVTRCTEWLHEKHLSCLNSRER